MDLDVVSSPARYHNLFLPSYHGLCDPQWNLSRLHDVHAVYLLNPAVPVAKVI